jgi:radical SAM superfamily enzyme YgiQ (UPF0313 family)
MRVALIQAPQNNDLCLVPINLLSLASYIDHYNYQPIIVDLNVQFKKNKYHPDFFKKAAKKILRHKPQVLGFSVLCASLPATLLIAKECKRLAPQLPVIFGGPEVSFEETEVLKTFNQVDIIVRGEGEITLLEILKSMEMKKPFSEILGITYRDGKQVKRNPDRPIIKDLDKLPYLDYSLLPKLERYKGGRIEAGRGCPYKCTFCPTCKRWKRTYRIKSPQRLAQEMKQARRAFVKHSFPYIRIIHDNFLASRKTTKKFLSLMANQGISWLCDARFDVLDEDLIKKMKIAGCRGILFGIETGSPKIQKEIKKNLPLEKLPKILSMISQQEILATLSIILGFPNENKNQINQTLQMALKSKLYSFSPHILPQLLTFLKGSELYEKAKEGFMRPYLQQTKSVPLLTDLPAELSLINKYPHIFPSFYIIKEKVLGQEFLEKICVLILFLIDSFPFTTLLFVRFLSVSPLKLFQKIIYFFDSKGADWTIFQDGKRGFLYYLHFFEKFIKNNSTPLIKETFLHEKLYQKSSFAKNAPFCSRTKINFNSRPKIVRKVAIRTYNYDIFALMDKLRTSQIKNIPKAKTHVAYVPGEIARVVSLTALSYYLLSLCNGKRSVREIMHECLDRKARTKKAKKIILVNFNFLQERGIVYAKGS